eukprot:Rmarinus@m.18483
MYRNSRILTLFCWFCFWMVSTGCLPQADIPSISVVADLKSKVVKMQDEFRVKWMTRGLDEFNLTMSIISNGKLVSSMPVRHNSGFFMQGVQNGICEINVYPTTDGKLISYNGTVVKGTLVLRSLPIQTWLSPIEACNQDEDGSAPHLDFWGAPDVSVTTFCSPLIVSDGELNFWFTMLVHQDLEGIEVLVEKARLQDPAQPPIDTQRARLCSAFEKQRPIPNIAQIDTKAGEVLNPIFAAAMGSKAEYVVLPTTKDLMWPGFLQDISSFLRAERPDFVLASTGEEGQRILAFKRRLFFPKNCSILAERIGTKWIYHGLTTMSEMAHAGITTWESLSRSYVDSWAAAGHVGRFYGRFPSSANWFESVMKNGTPFSWEIVSARKANSLRPSVDSSPFPLQDEPITCDALDPKFVFFLRVPKSATSAVQVLMNSLNNTLGYEIVPMVFQGMAAGLVRNYYRGTFFAHRVAHYLVENKLTLPDHVLSDGHAYFVPDDVYLSANVPAPVWFSIVRDPVSRLRSEYDYLRWGEHKKSNETEVTLQMYPELDVPMEDCLDGLRNGRPTSQAMDCGGFNVLVRFFCGDDPWCQDGSRAGLEQAKQNIRGKFPVVGLSERFRDTARVLEKILPGYFGGASKKVGTKFQYNKNRTKPSKLAEKDIELLSKLNTLDFELYEWIKDRFDRQMHLCFGHI